MKQTALNSIHISVARQRLTLKRGGAVVRAFPISTSRFGLGMEEGSFKTPTGRFRVADKIGAGQPLNTAYKARVPLPATPAMLKADDLVMSRILWLDGLDSDNSNTYERYIYIHGTNHENQIGQTASHGCIRMKNADVAELYELVRVGTPVVITPPKARKPAAERARKALRERRSLTK